MIVKTALERKGISAIQVVRKIAHAILSMTDSEIKILFDLREEVDLAEISKPLGVALGIQHPVMIRMRKVTFR